MSKGQRKSHQNFTILKPNVNYKRGSSHSHTATTTFYGPIRIDLNFKYTLCIRSARVGLGWVTECCICKTKIPINRFQWTVWTKPDYSLDGESCLQLTTIWKRTGTEHWNGGGKESECTKRHTFRRWRLIFTQCYDFLANWIFFYQDILVCMHIVYSNIRRIFGFG